MRLPFAARCRLLLHTFCLPGKGGSGRLRGGLAAMTVAKGPTLGQADGPDAHGLSGHCAWGGIPMQIATPYDDRFEEASRERILVVEDNGGLGRTLTLAIRCLGCDATVVATVRGAIELLADLEEWAGIILDLSLGDGPGLSVLEWVRERDRDISVLIHTAHTEHAAISAAFNLQAYFLEKPSTPAQIERFLRVAEASARQRRARRSGTPGGEDLPEDLRELVGGVLSTAVELGTKESEYAYRLALLARAANGRRLDGRSATGACADAVSVS